MRSTPHKGTLQQPGSPKTDGNFCYCVWWLVSIRPRARETDTDPAVLLSVTEHVGEQYTQWRTQKQMWDIFRSVTLGV